MTDKLSSYGEALRSLGMQQRHARGGRSNNRVEPCVTSIPPPFLNGTPLSAWREQSRAATLAQEFPEDVAMPMSEFRTSDGIVLNYLEAGDGPALVLLHGWSGSAELFKHQFAALQQHFRVIALDMRGHGQSEKPTYGYRVSRLAKDLREFLESLDLKHVRLLGHSAGCSVIWCYWDLFGSERISKLVLVDQHPVIVAHPTWSMLERQSFGAIVDANELYQLADDLSGPNGADVTEKLLSRMVTSAISRQEKRSILDAALQFPRKFAAQLIVDVATHDWRDTIARLTTPTLIVSGRGSQVPWQSQVWMQTQIAGSHLEIFEEAEGGRHFMFLEAPIKFNSIVADFLA